MGVPGCPELAFCTASIERVRMVLTHSSSSVERSVTTDKGSPLGVECSGHGNGRVASVRPCLPGGKAAVTSGVPDLPMWGCDLSRSFDGASQTSRGATVHPIVAAAMVNE